MTEPLTILVAARDEQDGIAETVRSLRKQFHDAEVIVADDGSRDRTGDAAEEAGATVLRLRRRGKGEALTAAERAAPPGRLLLVDADVRGDLGPLGASGTVPFGVRIARFAVREGGGFGIAKSVARWLIHLRSGFDPREPLSGQRVLAPPARAAVFPLAPGFGCETRMTIDAVRAGIAVEEVEADLRHRSTHRDVRGFTHRARQLLDIVLACGPLAVNFRGLRLPLVGWLVGLRRDGAVAAVAALGLADDLWSGSERGFRAHLHGGATTGTLKLVGIPLVGWLATRRLSGAFLIGLAANAMNQLDTRPGRVLKAYVFAAVPLRAPLGVAVLLLPYDLRERAMLGDAGSNALGAMLGLRSVSRLTERGRWIVIAGLATLTIVGERRSLGALVEHTPVLRELDAVGRMS